MQLDPDQEKINRIIIKCGRLLFPEEKNVTTLLQKTSELLKIPVVSIPAPHRSQIPAPPMPDPLFPCPSCAANTLLIQDICPHCEESAGGKFHTKLICSACSFSELSPKFRIQWYNHFGFQFKTGLKTDLGIKTITDKGVV